MSSYWVDDKIKDVIWYITFNTQKLILFFFTADGMTYSFGMFYVEFLDYFNEGKGYTAWIVSLLVGVTLCSGECATWFRNSLFFMVLFCHINDYYFFYEFVDWSSFFRLDFSRTFFSCCKTYYLSGIFDNVSFKWNRVITR